MIQTRFTKDFGIDAPIVSAPMAMHSDGTLAAAVSSAGGLGTFGAAGPLVDPAFVREQIRIVRAQTDKPFGVGFITHLLSDHPQTFDAALEERVPVIFFSFADPTSWIERARASHAKVICQVHTVDAARVAASAGANALIAQGNEAGGHTGELNLLPFLSRLIDEFPGIPILAAGGIAAGRSLAAVLAAGAEGASLGTAFLATHEAPVPESLKELIVDSTAEDTVYTRLFDILSNARSGFPPWPTSIAARTYNNAFVQKWSGREHELTDHLEEAINDREDSGDTFGFFGESASFIREIQSAKSVIGSICSDAEALLSARARIVVT